MDKASSGLPRPLVLPCFALFCRESMEYPGDQMGGFFLFFFCKWMPQLVFMGEGPIGHANGGKMMEGRGRNGRVCCAGHGVERKQLSHPNGG